MPAMVNVYQLIECADAEIESGRSRIEKHVQLLTSKREDNLYSVIEKLGKPSKSCHKTMNVF